MVALRIALAFTAASLSLGLPSEAAIFSEDFDGPGLDSNLEVSEAPGFTFQLSAGLGSFSKSAGVGNGSARVKTTFTVTGDFSATIIAHRSSLAGDGEAGIVTRHETGFTDVFFFGNSQVNSNIFVAPISSSKTSSTGASDVTFRIRRVGSDLFHEFDAGSGFQELQTAQASELSGPVTIELFLVQEFGNTNAHGVSFNDLSIMSDGLGSPPGTVVFTETFDGPTLDPRLSVDEPPGFSFALSSGQGVFSKTAGTGDGKVSLSTSFTLFGDFSATVTAERASLSGFGEAGLAAQHQNGFTDVFFFGDEEINSNIFVAPLNSTQILDTTAAMVEFRIRRVGMNVFHEVDTGSGFQLLNSASDVALLGPVTIELFLLQRLGNTDAHSVSFDDLSIEADGLHLSGVTVPVLSPLGLVMTGLLLFAAMVLVIRRRAVLGTQAGGLADALAASPDGPPGGLAIRERRPGFRLVPSKRSGS